MTRIIHLILLISFGITKVIAQPAGYAWGKQLLVDKTKVSGSSNLIDFPMLVNMVDPDLRSVSNGGHVENSNGYDIIFTYGDCGTTTLAHQIEKYNPATGELIAWVKVNQLNANSNTNLHMYYGNPSITTDPSTTATWNSHIAAVYHFSNNDFSDGSPNAMHGNNFSTTNVTGKIGDARDFNNSKYVQVPESGTTSLDLQQLTMNAWIYPTDYNVISDRGIIINKESRYEMGLRDLGGEFQGASRPGCWRWAGTRVIPLNTWSRVTMVFNGGVERHYVNGVWIEDFNDCSNPLSVNDEDLVIGARGGDVGIGSFFKGRIDEVKLSDREETADWIKTEYTNQNDPNTFYIKSVEMTAHDLCFTLPIELNYFQAKLNTKREVEITWSTFSEIDNDYFEVQRSTDLANWSTLQKIKGAGNSLNEISYQYTDREPKEGNSYYRIKQVDFDGQNSFSNIEIITLSPLFQSISCSPNPSSANTTITSSDIQQKDTKIEIYNSLGVICNVPYSFTSQHSIQFDFSLQPAGLYFIRLSRLGQSKMVKFLKK